MQSTITRASSRRRSTRNESASVLRARSPLSEQERSEGANDALRADDASLLDLVEAVRALPYGRPSDRTVEGMLRERRGTCSTKHLFLARRLAERFPETEPQIVHRVYTLDLPRARALFGAQIAETITDEGLVDVHRYITVMLNGRCVTLDATFPGTTWDGCSSLPLACGPGEDYLAGDDPDMEKRALEEQYCDPTVREPFIAALTRADSLGPYPSRTDGYRHRCVDAASDPSVHRA